jgi:nucleoside-diphosphate-sugar epimerase
VRVCARHGDRLAPLAALGARVVELDAARPHVFRPALAGSSAPRVVYSIPPIAGLPAGEAVRRAAVAATGAAAHAFVYLGSTGVYGQQISDEWVDEDTTVAASDPEAAPRLAEEAAVQLAALGGLRAVTLRLAAIYGPGRGVRERLKAGTYRLIDGGRHHFSRVYVDDLVSVIRAAAERAPSGALYCVADDHPSTQREYTDWLCARLGLPPLTEANEDAASPMRRFVRNRRISNARMKSELGVALRYPSYREGEKAIEAALP